MTLLSLLSGCIFVYDDGPRHGDGDGWMDDRTCHEVEAELDAEARSIRACVSDDQCGQVLEGTSCGCTRDQVARNDADTTRFEGLMDEAAALSCDAGMDSTCDCPEADGFVCGDDGYCAWNYVEATEPPEDFSACDGDAGDAYTLDGVEVSGDTLALVVSYSGGCETHAWTICWPDQAFMESDPVQVTLEPLHDANGDACEAWITEAVGFDLTPLQTAYQAAYGTETGTIVVNVGGRAVTYTF